MTKGTTEFGLNKFKYGQPVQNFTNLYFRYNCKPSLTGVEVGDIEGALEGIVVGASDGDCVGKIVGLCVGIRVSAKFCML